MSLLFNMLSRFVIAVLAHKCQQGPATVTTQNARHWQPDLARPFRVGSSGASASYQPESAKARDPRHTLPPVRLHLSHSWSKPRRTKCLFGMNGPHVTARGVLQLEVLKPKPQSLTWVTWGNSTGLSKPWFLESLNQNNNVSCARKRPNKTCICWSWLCSHWQERHRGWARARQPGFRQSVFVCSAVSNSLRTHGLQPGRLLCPWDFLDKNTRVGCHFLLQGIFPIWGSNLNILHLLHWQGDSLPLSHQRSPSKDIIRSYLTSIKPRYNKVLYWYLVLMTLKTCLY